MARLHSADGSGVHTDLRLGERLRNKYNLIERTPVYVCFIFFSGCCLSFNAAVVMFVYLSVRLFALTPSRLLFARSRRERSTPTWRHSSPLSSSLMSRRSTSTRFTVTLQVSVLRTHGRADTKTSLQHAIDHSSLRLPLSLMVVIEETAHIQSTWNWIQMCIIVWIGTACIYLCLCMCVVYIVIAAAIYTSREWPRLSKCDDLSFHPLSCHWKPCLSSLSLFGLTPKLSA